MKRKKWSELEERTLLTMYSELLNSGTLAKLKTRERKFKPIADHVNSVHHLQLPITFPFKWTWRDVSIKVQNMRHQYLGVKQKIRASNGEFNWSDGENHWENFLKYKEVFGDLELELKENTKIVDDGEDDDDILGLGFGFHDDDDDHDDHDDIDEVDKDDDGLGVSDSVQRDEFEDDFGFARRKKLKNGLAGAQVLELRNVVMRREEKRADREWRHEEDALEREEGRMHMEKRREKRVREREEEVEVRECELEERHMVWARREFDHRLRLEREVVGERRWRMKVEEKWEEEEMKWRERMVTMQIEHEKQMMQMHADACQNQMQVLGVMARLVCQFFGSTNDGLGVGLGTLPPQVLQNLQHSGGLVNSGKPDANSHSEFL